MPLEIAIPVIVALLTILGTYALKRYAVRQSAHNAFRNNVIDLLDGFYPAPGSWNMGFETKLKEKIPLLEKEVEKFRFHVPRHKHRGYDIAWDILKDLATNTTWLTCAAYTMYPEERASGEQDPKDEFCKAVDRLLSYAKEI